MGVGSDFDGAGVGLEDWEGDGVDGGETQDGEGAAECRACCQCGDV